jgi:UDP-glucose 4-epimerase
MRRPALASIDCSVPNAGVPNVVLVTGVSRYLGSRIAARIAADDAVERVIGVDTVPPSRNARTMLGRTEFMRADIRNPLIAKVISRAAVDTVVHMSLLATPRDAGGRSSMKEVNVLGTMQLLAACQAAPSMRKLVVKSTTAVYGSSPRDPAAFTEDDEPRALPQGGYAKDAVEVEGYVRGFGRRRPDVAVTLLRFANFLDKGIDTPLTRYFSLPAVPTVFGFDPRLQFVHASDGLDVLERAIHADRPGTYNVAGPGVLLLSQAIRRAGQVPIPVPEFAASTLGMLVRHSGAVDFSAEQVRFLAYGRVVDTTRLAEGFGFVPRFSTVDAFDDFVRSRDLPAVLGAEVIAAAERKIASRLGVGIPRG